MEVVLREARWGCPGLENNNIVGNGMDRGSIMAWGITRKRDTEHFIVFWMNICIMINDTYDY